MDKKMAVFLIATLLVPRLLAGKGCYGNYPLTLLVYNSLTNSPNLTYISSVVYEGILLSAMTRLKESSSSFSFSYYDTDDYGPYLESINGVAGEDAKQTYWELLVKLGNGTVIRPDVGIGCYVPEPNQEIIFKYKNY